MPPFLLVGCHFLGKTYIQVGTLPILSSDCFLAHQIQKRVVNTNMEQSLKLLMGEPGRTTLHQCLYGRFKRTILRKTHILIKPKPTLVEFGDVFQRVITTGMGVTGPITYILEAAKHTCAGPCIESSI